MSIKVFSPTSAFHLRNTVDRASPRLLLIYGTNWFSYLRHRYAELPAQQPLKHVDHDAVGGCISLYRMFSESKQRHSETLEVISPDRQETAHNIAPAIFKSAN